LKTEKLLLVGALAAAALYFLGKPKSDNGTFVGEPVMTSSGNVITAQAVDTLREAGMSAADIVNYTTARNDVEFAMLPMSARSIRIETSKGGLRTVSLPPPSATNTSRNGNQYLAPRSGGGYRTVGAKNITLNPSKVKSNSNVTLGGKTYRLNN